MMASLLNRTTKTTPEVNTRLTHAPPPLCYSNDRSPFFSRFRSAHTIAPATMQAEKGIPMRSIPLFILIAVMTSCGVPETPLAQIATPSPVPVASATVVQATVMFEPSAVPSVEPSVVATAVSGGALPIVIDGPQPGSGEVLLRDVWGASATLASASPTRYMLYGESTPAQEDVSVPAKTTLWKIDLSDTSQRTPLFDIPFSSHANELLYGELSPDKTYLSYSRTGAVMDGRAELIMMRLDGSDEQLITTQFTVAESLGGKGFAWSPDSTKIAYIVPQEEGQTFYVYDLKTQISTLLYAHTGGGMFGSWLDNERVLVFLVTDQEKPMQMTALNTTSGAQEILGEFPRWGDVTVALSPDQTQLLISEYVYDISSNQFTQIDNIVNRAFWSPDGQTITSLIENTGTTLQVAPTTGGKALEVALFSSDTTNKNFEYRGRSPDGHYLSICQGDGNAIPFEKTTIRDLIYDVQSNQWIVLKQGLYVEGVQCGRLIGWL